MNDQRQSDSSGKVQAQEIPTKSLYRILVLDDEEKFLKMVKRRLEKMNYTVLVTSNYLEFIQVLDQGEPVDLIMLDQVMPQKNGLSIYEELGHRPELPPVIMITAYGNIPLAVEFMKKGGVDFIEKPIDFDVLDFKIKQAINHYELQIQCREAQEQVHQSLKEKEMLLREIHHRTKNNLSFISGMLSLQSIAFRDDKKVTDAFKNCRDRINSISVIHDELYKSENFLMVDTEAYVVRLTYLLKQMYSAGNLITHVDVNQKPLEFDSALALGLIINELVTNAYKYARSGSLNRELQIRLDLSSTPENKLQLIISDNGVGLPDGLDFKSVETIGLSLVKGFLMNLDGTIELSSEKNQGTQFTIRFPFQRSPVKRGGNSAGS